MMLPCGRRPGHHSGTAREVTAGGPVLSAGSPPTVQTHTSVPATRTVIARPTAEEMAVVRFSCSPATMPVRSAPDRPATRSMGEVGCEHGRDVQRRLLGVPIAVRFCPAPCGAVASHGVRGDDGSGSVDLPRYARRYAPGEPPVWRDRARRTASSTMDRATTASSVFCV